MKCLAAKGLLVMLIIPTSGSIIRATWTSRTFRTFLNTSRKDVAKPGSGTVEALELKLFPASGYSQTRIESLALSTQKTYVVVFDYWSDVAGAEFHLGLYGTDKAWIFYQCGTVVKNERLEISTTNPNMANTWFYYEVLGGNGSSGNVYISNFRFYEKGGAGSGATPIDPRPFRYSGAFFDLSSGVYTKDFVNFWQTSKQSIAKPGSGVVEETLVIGTVEHAVANTDVLNLTPGVDYILEFDFWADTAGNGFHVDLVTPDWNNVFAGHRQATKTPQHAQFTVNSSSPYINNVNLRFFYNSGAGNNVGNVYISNIRLYNKDAAENGWYLGTDNAVKASDFKWFTNSNKTTVVPPGRIKATEALSIKPINHAVASTDTMSLRQNTEYILEFDYWGDVAGDIIITDLFPDDLPESFFLVSTSVKRARISISSNSANMTASCLRFFINTGYGYTNQGNVYAANILFYEKSSIGKAPADTNPFRYAGEYYDYEMGTYYLRARIYRPSMGRFTQQDPTRAGLNWYVYANNNPLLFIDPSGLVGQTIINYYAKQGYTGILVDKTNYAIFYKSDSKGNKTYAYYTKGKRITFPDTVYGKVNGVDKELKPNDEWGAAGKGQYPDGVQKDAEGKYKVAVGPKILDPNYPNTGRIWRDDFASLNKDISVILEHKTTGEIKIIDCTVTDIKAHSYNKYPDGHKKSTLGTGYFDVENGLIQTGISYPNSSNASQSLAFSPDHVGGATVIEFAGKEVDFDLGNYTLVGVVTYN